MVSNASSWEGGLARQVKPMRPKPIGPTSLPRIWGIVMRLYTGINDCLEWLEVGTGEVAT